MQPCLIIANKGAGSFSQQGLDDCCRLLARSGRDVEQLPCSDFAGMTEAAAKFSQAIDAPLIIAAGGDGTINAVFNGLAGNSASCAILPLGTANVLAIELGFKSPQDAAQRIIAGRHRPLTAGVVSSNRKSSRFFLMTGAGFDGAVVRGVTAALKSRFGKGAYLLSALARLASWERGELQITVEGRSFNCHSLIVCNAAHYGGHFRLAPAASLFSPTLELLAVTATGRSGVVGLAAEALCDWRSSAITRLSAEHITISGTKAVQVDGDDWGETPLEIFAEANFATLIV